MCVDVAAVQETHLTCGADCRVLESDFNVFSAYGSSTSAGVSLLVGRSLDADVDVVFAGDGANWLWPMLPLKVSRWQERVKGICTVSHALIMMMPLYT